MVALWTSMGAYFIAPQAAPAIGPWSGDTGRLGAENERVPDVAAEAMFSETRAKLNRRTIQQFGEANHHERKVVGHRVCTERIRTVSAGAEAADSMEQHVCLQRGRDF